MVGIVIVSHSEKLAAGVVEIARMMAPNAPLAAAGGLEDGELGTSYARISAAVEAVYSEDGQDGPLALLNLILRVRSELKKAGTIGGGQFALELPLEYIVYQDTTPPYYMGEMVTNWSMPVTQRDVAEILHNL